MFGANKPNSSSPFGGTGENLFQEQQTNPTFTQSLDSSGKFSTFGNVTATTSGAEVSTFGTLSPTTSGARFSTFGTLTPTTSGAGFSTFGTVTLTTTGSTMFQSAGSSNHGSPRSTNLFSTAELKPRAFGALVASSGGTTASGQNLFAQFAAPSSSTIIPSSSVGSMGSAGSVFGGAKLFGSSSRSSTSQIFGDESKPAVLFGQPAGAAQSTSSSALFQEPAKMSQPQTLFGKPVKSSSTSSALFQEPAETSQPQTLFGKPVESSLTSSALFQEPAKMSQPQTVFGKPVESSSTSSALFQEPAKMSQPQTLFGKPVKSSSTSSALFQEPAETSQPQTLFGKPVESSLTSSALFQEPAKMSQPQTVFGKPVESSSTSSPLFQEPAETSQPQTLFGKPVEASAMSSATLFGGEKSQAKFGHSSDDAPEPTPKPGPAKARILFGKKVAEDPLLTTDEESRLNHPGGEAETLDEDNVFGVKKPLFGKIVAEKPGRKSLIKRVQSGEQRGGSGARSIFNKALFGATGKPVVPRTRKEPVESRDQQHGNVKPREEDASTSRSTMSSRVSKKYVRKEVEDELASMAGKETKSTSRRLSRTLSSPDEAAKRVAIVCKDVPVSVSVFQLRKHFNTFGPVAKVYPNPGKRSATIHFKSHAHAANAKLKGHVIGDQPPLQIFWSSHVPSPKSSMSERARESKPASRSSTSLRSMKSARSEVDDELASMAGTSDISTEFYHAFERSDHSPKKSSTRKPPTRDSQRSVSPSRAPVTPASPQKSTTAAVNKASMEVLLTAAKNTLDMYQVLDARDKLFRQGRKKQWDLKTAVAVSGTCPDMCPEKERYDRDAKRRLSMWEIIPGTENVPGQNPKVDHTRAVKEYSRSSADQEEPLPLEMRPGPVLEMTMTYLLMEIADKGDERNWLDWYDFLWNRTRGIRKDITQQMLCDRTVVDLTEKCARFHIYCAERLCEEDFHTFDQNINTENLTKCLQSLKELYADLASKQQVYCSTEVEFRAYLVLMNLNEGDTLREVQQLRQEVRESLAINFALRVYSALNSNNYIRFFKLAKRATFLNACIMHRYFVQVRSRALKTMLRAYAIGDRPVQYPLIDLVRMLAFEDIEEASEFCQHYGLTARGGEVVLDRRAYIEPELGLSMRRAIHLIESKLQVSVGQVINGEPFPPLPIHVPNSSFDEMGKYEGEMPVLSNLPPDAERKIKSEVPPSVVEEAGPSITPPLPIKPPKLQVPNVMVKEVVRELFLEVINEFCSDISSSLYRAIHVYLETNAEELWESTYQDVASPMIRAMCSNILQDEREKKQREEEIAARIVSRESAARSEMDYMIQEVVDQEISNTATTEIRDVHAQLNRERQERCTEIIEDDLRLDVLDDVLLEIAEEVFEVDVVQRQRQLNELEKCIQLYHTAKFFQTWKKTYASCLRLKRSMLTFPCGPSGESLEDQVNLLIPNREQDRIHEGVVYLNKVARLHVQSPLVADEKQRWLDGRITLHLLMNRLRHDVAWSPFNLGEIIGRQLLQESKSPRNQRVFKENRVYWKLVLSLPEPEDETISHTSKFCDWMRSKFTKGVVPLQEEDCEKIQTLSLYTTPVRLPQQPVLHFGVCVKAITGTLQDEEVENLEEENTLLGTGAFLFVLDPQEGEDMNYWLEAQLRLVRVLQAKPICPRVPLVVVLPESTNSFPPTGRIYDLLNLLSLIEEGLVSSIHIVTLEYSPVTGVDILSHSSTNELEEAIRWFGLHIPPQPELASKPLQALIEEILAAEFYSPVFHNLKQRKLLGHLHQPPDVLIMLYNSVITYIQKLVTAPVLKVHSWPVTEFTRTHRDLPRPYWNSEHHLIFLHDTLQCLVLPDVNYQDVESDTWSQASADVWDFVTSVVEGHEKGPQKTQFMSRIRHLLHKTETDFEDTCFLVEADRLCEPLYVNMPWTDVVMAAVDYRLLATDLTDPNQEEQEDLMVYYGKESSPFDPPMSWKMAVSDRETAAGTMVNTTIHKAAEKKRQLSLDAKDETFSAKKVRFSSASELLFDVTPLSEEALVTNCVSIALSAALAEEKRESEIFEDFLRNALHSESELASECPLKPVFVVTDPNMFTPMPTATPGVAPDPKFTSVFTPKLHIDDNMGEFRRILSMEAKKGVTSPETIALSLSMLKEEVAANKRANELYEMRLQSFLNS